MSEPDMNTNKHFKSQRIVRRLADGRKIKMEQIESMDPVTKRRIYLLLELR
jgi:hypothetical protein